MLTHLRKQIVLVQHYRHAAGVLTWECPRGGLDADTTLDKTIQNEIREEIGGEMVDCRRLGHILPVNNLINAGVDIFLVELMNFGNTDASEGVESVQCFSVGEVKQMICESVISDALTVCAVAQASFLGLLD